MKKVLFVFNPVAGTAKVKKNLFEIVDFYDQNNCLVTAVPQRRRRSSCHYFIWLFTNQERQPCKRVSGRLQRISGNGRLSGL